MNVDPSYDREIRDWCRKREDNLLAPRGWLSVIGLFWLEEGANLVGSSPEAAVVLPRGPARVGILQVEPEGVTFRAAPGTPVTSEGEAVTEVAMVADTPVRQANLVELDDLGWYVLERGERFAVRLKDSRSPARQAFRGIPRFPTDESWRVTGRLESIPRTLRVPNTLGFQEEAPSPGRVIFEAAGRPGALTVIQYSPEHPYFVVFGDATSGTDTYGGGRFLYSRPADVGGEVVLDFNKAYNPPCVFSPHATCPLPLPGNRLPFRVEAGEKVFRLAV